MTSIHHVMFASLVPPDAIAAMKLRADLDEICARNDAFAVESGPVNEIILHGSGELPLERMVDRLKRELGHDFKVSGPQVAYRETITKKIEWSYSHKKQTGGTGQYARVKVRFEPSESGSGFRFESIIRDEISPEFISAVMKGLKVEAQRGPVAGFPLIDLRCTLVDGDYHEVDSNRTTFEIAARACLRGALPKAGPVLLEPMMLVVVLTPEDHMGDVIGDLNTRRGQVRGMDSVGVLRAISALVPLADMFGYVSTLRAMTRGRADYVAAFSHYEQVPRSPPPGDDGPITPAAALRG